MSPQMCSFPCESTGCGRKLEFDPRDMNIWTALRIGWDGYQRLDGRVAVWCGWHKHEREAYIARGGIQQPLTADEVKVIRLSAWGDAPIIGINDLVMRLAVEHNRLRARVEELTQRGNELARSIPRNVHTRLCCPYIDAWAAAVEEKP